MREILEHKIKIYEFPETDDEEENKIVKTIKVRKYKGIKKLFLIYCGDKDLIFKLCAVYQVAAY